MSKEDNLKIIDDFFKNNQVELYGIIDLRKFPDVQNFIHPSILEFSTTQPYVISYGLKLSGSILETIKDTPNLLYAFHYRRVNECLDLIGIKLSNLLEQNGFAAMPFAASQVLDFQKRSAHISHRHIAYFAGLGWFGRNNLIVNPKYGSQVRYASILTDMHLPLTQLINSNCGSCKICMNACPAQAIKENSKDFDGEKCYAQLKEFSKLPGIHHLICGICIQACKGKKNGNN